MPKLPSVGGEDVIKAFEAVGFRIKRKEGSHRIMGREGHRYNLSVSVHKGETIPHGTLRSLIRLSGLTVEEFIKLLR